MTNFEKKKFQVYMNQSDKYDKNYDKIFKKKKYFFICCNNKIESNSKILECPICGKKIKIIWSQQEKRNIVMEEDNDKKK